ncbi:hypothetical protein J7K50_01780 [bacterium]|nr:hypothetical protein [bacterium]
MESGAADIVQDIGTQAAGPNPVWILLAIVVLCLIVAGPRFFVHLFQVYVLPHLSLRRVAEDDHMFHAIALVLAGSAAFVLFLALASPQLTSVADDWIQATVTTETASSSSPYKDVAQDRAVNDLSGYYQLVFIDNILVLPIVPVVYWFVLMSFIWIFAKIFQTPVAYGHFLRTVAYNGFIYGVASGLMVYQAIIAQAGGTLPPWITPVAFILGIYAVVHFFISIVQGLNINTTGIVVSLILAFVLLAGILYFINYQYLTPAWDEYWSRINSFDPSRIGGLF